MLFCWESNFMASLVSIQKKVDVGLRHRGELQTKQSSRIWCCVCRKKNELGAETFYCVLLAGTEIVIHLSPGSCALQADARMHRIPGRPHHAVFVENAPGPSISSGN